MTERTSPWLWRQMPRWGFSLAVCLAAIVALTQGAHGWAEFLCWILLVVDGVVVVGVALALARHRRTLSAIARGEPPRAGPRDGPTTRADRIIALEGTFLGLLFVFIGLDALATIKPAAFGVATLLFGIQLLLDYRRRRRRRS